MFLGRTPHRGPFVDKRGMYGRAADILVDLKIRVPSVRVPVGLLSGGQRQGVAVARSVLQGGEIFIMDEPTAALGVRETAQVIEIIGELREQGKAVIVISHDLEVVFEIADRVQVLRLGRLVGVRRTRETDRSEIVGLITGTVGPDSVE
jgi:ABC-type sugar transport system ATPase subunit